MMKIRAVMIFAMAQAALAKEHTSGRSADAVNTADPAIRLLECSDKQFVQHLPFVCDQDHGQFEHDQTVHKSLHPSCFFCCSMIWF